MAEKAVSDDKDSKPDFGYDQPPPYSGGQTGYSNQHGADFGGPKSDANPQSGGADSYQGGAHPIQGGAYPPAGGAYVAQPGYGQAYSHTTTTGIVNQPGAAGRIVVQPRPPDYLIPSLIACLCCFWPTGLCAINYALQANKLAAEGHMAAATRMSNNARNFMISSIVIGIIWITIVIVFRVLAYSESTTYNHYKY